MGGTAVTPASLKATALFYNVWYLNFNEGGRKMDSAHEGGGVATTYSRINRSAGRWGRLGDPRSPGVHLHVGKCALVGSQGSEGKMASRAQKKDLGGHSLPGLRSQESPPQLCRLCSSSPLWWDSLLCRHRREPCFSPTCWQFSEMQGTPGQKQLPDPSKIHPTSSPLERKQNVAQETAPSASIFHIWSFRFTPCLNLCGSALYTEPGVVGCVSGKYFMMSVAGIPLSMFQCFW